MGFTVGAASRGHTMPRRIFLHQIRYLCLIVNRTIRDVLSPNGMM